MQSVVIDTNIFINKPSFLGEFLTDYKVIIPIVVLEELDSQNHRKNQSISYYARRAIKEINKYLEHENIVFDNTVDSDEKNDNVILRVAKENDAMILTFDLAMKMKAKFMDIKVAEVEELQDRLKESEYKGYQIWELDLSDERDEFALASLYSGNFESEDDDFVENEYLIIKDVDKCEYIDAFKYMNGKFNRVERKSIKSSHFEEIKARDYIQHCAIDSLRHDKITMIKGRAGSGKTYLSLGYAMEQIDKGNYDKVIFFVNPTPAKNAQELGFRPGDTVEKLMSSSVGACLSTKFGGMDGVLRLINDNIIQILPMVDIRGVDTGSQNVIVYVLEAQNLDIELMKLGLQRIGTNAKVIIDGDYTTQVDNEAYANGNNGMKRMAEIFRGSDMYGEVELKTIYRSQIAELADLM